MGAGHGESALNAGDPGLILLAGSVVVLVAIVAARITHRIGLPGLLVFLGLGLALGEAGLGVRFDNAQLAQALGTSALVLILAEGGLTRDRRRGDQHRRRRSGLPLATVLRLAQRLVAQRGAGANGRGGGVLGPAQAATPAATVGDAGGRVGPQ